MGIPCRRRPALSLSMLLATFVLTLAVDGKSPGVFSFLRYCFCAH